MSSLLSPEDRRVVARLRLSPRRAHLGRQRGERVTKQKGVSIEFADYREYAEGDDLRHLDWNALARLGTAVVKTYEDEQDLQVHLLVDLSASMDFGTPSKREGAKRLGAALGGVALASGDAVRPVALGVNARPERTLRGLSGLARLERWLGAAGRPSPVPISQAVMQWASGDLGNGVVLLVTDGLDPALAGVFRPLAARGLEPWVLLVLSQEELDPDLEGDLKLVDPEGGEAVEVTANRATLEAYQAALQAHIDGLRQAAVSAGGRFALARPSDSVAEVLGQTCRREGWFS